MKAVTIHRHGEPEEIRLDEVPKPRSGANEVVIRLMAASLNHLDIWVRKGIPGLKFSFPHIMGSDGAGIVDRTGKGVKWLRKGDRVLIDPGISCGRCEFCERGEQSECVSFGLLGEHIHGTFAEYVGVPVENVHPIPSHLSFEEAAALPLVFLTAWRMLVTRAQLKAGEDLLVIGIGGGVASAALQIGLAMGVRVIATSGDPKKVKQALELGAHHAFNHNDRDIAEEARKATGNRGADVCAETVGAATWSKSLQALAKGGRLVTCGATTGPMGETDIRRVFWNQLTILGSTMGSRSDCREMLRFVERTGIRPIIDSTYPLEKARAAHERLMRREQFGKIVLTIGQDSLSFQ